MSINRIGSLLPTRCLDEAYLTVLPEPVWIAPQRFHPGNRVRVQRGVFQGVEGTVVSFRSSSRLLIAVDLDCQGVSLEIDERLVEVLES